MIENNKINHEYKMLQIDHSLVQRDIINCKKELEYYETVNERLKIQLERSHLKFKKLEYNSFNLISNY